MAPDSAFYDSVKGVVILVKLPTTAHNLWTTAANEAGLEPYATDRWEDCYVVAGGKRPTTVVTTASMDLDARLFDVSDPVYRSVTSIVTSDASADILLWRRLAWDSLPVDAPRDEIISTLKIAYAESRLRCIDWDLVEDYHNREHSLSDDERLVLAAVCAGKLNKQIASELGVSIRTVEQRRRRVFSKMGVDSAVPLADRTATVRTLERRVSRRDRAQSVPPPKMISHGKMPAPHIAKDGLA